MRASLGLAAITFALTTLSAPLFTSPAAAFDDTLPRWAPYRAHHYAWHHHCHRLFWRERCGPYRLGGYFVRNPDFRRAPVFRRR
jgi:hypothetical protein